MSSGESAPVTKMIGRLPVWRNRRTTWVPSIPGRPVSTRARSGRKVLAASRAAGPSATAQTWHPSSSRMATKRPRAEGSSSTTSTRASAIHGYLLLADAQPCRHRRGRRERDDSDNPAEARRSLSPLEESLRLAAVVPTTKSRCVTNLHPTGGATPHENPFEADDHRLGR